MDPLRTEEEQLDAIKQWWEENGKSTVASVVLVAAGWLGWQYWDESKNAHREAGSAAFASLQSLVAQDELSDIQEASINTLVADLEAEYADTGYAQLAALEYAKFLATHGELVAAEDKLAYLLSTDIAPETRRVATLRLAKVQWANGASEDALATLDTGDTGSFNTLYNELRGDIYLSLGDKPKAIEHYQAALAGIDTLQPSQVDLQRQSLLEMKINSLTQI